jgi:arsenite-transporting ATPase
MEFLKRDVAFILVTIPEALAVEQLDGILAEMAKNGFQAGQLIINNVIREIGDSSFLKEKASQQRAYLEFVKRKYSQMQIVEIQLFPHEIKGIEQLKQVERCLFGEK